MRILFCDDNSAILTQLQQYVREFFENIGSLMPEFASYQNGVTLLNNEYSADIAFLDVEIPGINGIQLGARLKMQNPKIIIFIVTSYPDYLDEAMKYQVFRFLSKPIDKARLFRNLKEAIYQYNINTHEYPIVSSDGVVTYRAEDIICAETAHRKVLIYTTNKVIKSFENMDYWKNIFTLPCFYSPHRSYIINMRYVCQITKDTITLRFSGQQKDVYLARRRYTDFKDTYLFYMESVK